MQRTWVLIVFAVLAESIQSLFPCLTWDIQDGQLRLICKIEALVLQVTFLDTNRNPLGNCTDKGVALNCVSYHKSGNIKYNTDRNEVIFTLNINKTDINGNWTCLQGKDVYQTEVVISKGISTSTDIYLFGAINSTKTLYVITLRCFSCREPYENNVEFLDDHTSTDNLQYDHYSGKCVHTGGECNVDECSCVPSGNEFVRILRLDNIHDSHYFSCGMRFIDSIRSIAIVKYTTLFFNGTAFIFNGTETEEIYLDGEKNRPTDDPVINTEVMSTTPNTSLSTREVSIIVIGTVALLLSLIPGMISCFLIHKRYKKRKEHYRTKDDRYSKKVKTSDMPLLRFHTTADNLFQKVEVVQVNLPLLSSHTTDDNLSTKKETIDLPLLSSHTTDDNLSKKTEIIDLPLLTNRETARAHTQMSIEKHHKEKTFVHTHAVDKALACVKQNGVVVLIGSPGIGKSRIGIELLQQLSSGDQGYTAIELDDVSQWSDLIYSMDAVFIDDLFGRKNCHFDDNVYPRLLETIITAAEKGNVKVIITMRNSIYRKVADITAGGGIFHSQHIVDLDAKKLQMTVEEKTSILMNYLTINRIIVTDDPEKENISDYSINDASSPIYLHTNTLQNIIHSDQVPSIGFPETCYLFASHRKFTRTGLDFFCQPTELLYREIDNLKKDGKVNVASMVDFTLLVYIGLHGDSFNTHSIDLDKFGQIMTHVYLNSSPVVPFSYIDDAIKRLTGIYLKINNSSNYCFQHWLISEAVLKSYSADDLRRVTPVLNVDYKKDTNNNPKFF